MNRFECDLVMDLLPRYIDQKTSDETTRFMEAHMETCAECQAMYVAMSSDVDVVKTTEAKPKRFRLNAIGKMTLIVLGYLAFLIVALVIVTYIMANGVF